ncbi:MAG: GtrA family protein [Neisseriaceae bacterium]
MKKILKRIKRRHIKQLIIYGIVGVVALIVQMILYLVLCRLHLNPLYANLIGAGAGMVVAYKGHVRYTFEKNHKFSKSEFAKYVITALIGIAFNSTGIYLLVQVLKYHSDIGVIPVMLTPLLTFVINKFWSFR